MTITALQNSLQTTARRTRSLHKPKFTRKASATNQAKQYLPVIESIATGNPEYMIRQSDAAQVVANLPNLEQNRSRIEKLYSNTRIDTRHLAVNLLDESIVSITQHDTIQTRMQQYQKYAVPLAEQVSRKAIQSAAERSSEQQTKNSIGLIVFVSSTGFGAPGVDAALIEKLELPRNTARVTINFMGCAAAMNGLRTACDHVRAHPTHKVLLVCLELSSVNAVFDDEINDVIIHSIFGDGCAAVVVGACEAQAIAPGNIVIRDHLSYLIEGTTDGITLGVQDKGITCKLSRHLPDYIEAGVGSVVEGFLADHKLTKAEIDLWAIHPGGTKIIQKSQQALELTDAQVAPSWEVLRQYGNMLSPSVLFVLERMLFGAQPSQKLSQFDVAQPKNSLTGIAFSFSPGVGVEGILFQQF